MPYNRDFSGLLGVLYRFLRILRSLICMGLFGVRDFLEVKGGVRRRRSQLALFTGERFFNHCKISRKAIKLRI
jgi:hypothetical protein